MNILESLLTVGGKIFVFGAPYTTGRGVHDIHLNQGDPFLTKFSTQSLKTDNNGLPI